jgi:hypothetical protein
LVKIRDEKDISGLSNWAEKIFYSMDFMELGYNHEKKGGGEFRTQLFEDWDRNSKILLDLFGGGSKTRDLDECGWTKILHLALIIKTTNEGGMSINKLQLRDMMKSFVGRAVNEDEDLASLPGILACVEGMDGTVAILDADYKTEDGNFNDILEKVKWIYRLAILFYAYLNNYVDRLADRMFICQNTETKNPRENLRSFRNERLQLQLFLNESSPRTVAVDDATTQKIYNGLGRHVKETKQSKKLITN